jgi:hypothetical protein
VKIKLFHAECGREVLVQQIVQSQGHCPWDGKPFSRDYTAVLAQALQAAENAGGLFENALDKIADMHPAMSVDRDSILGTITASLDRLTRDREVARR